MLKSLLGHLLQYATVFSVRRHWERHMEAWPYKVFSALWNYVRADNCNTAQRKTHLCAAVCTLAGVFRGGMSVRKGWREMNYYYEVTKQICICRMHCGEVVVCFCVSAHHCSIMDSTASNAINARFGGCSVWHRLMASTNWWPSNRFVDIACISQSMRLHSQCWRAVDAVGSLKTRITNAASCCQLTKLAALGCGVQVDILCQLFVSSLQLRFFNIFLRSHRFCCVNVFCDSNCGGRFLSHPLLVKRRIFPNL